MDKNSDHPLRQKKTLKGHLQTFGLAVVFGLLAYALIYLIGWFVQAIHSL